MHEDLRGTFPETGSERRAKKRESRNRAREQVLHLVEEQQRARLPREQALEKPHLAESVVAHRLAAVLVRLTHGVERCAQPLGQRLAELGLAGARRTV